MKSNSSPYQWEQNLDKNSSSNIQDFQPEFGCSVIERYADGKAKLVKLKLYTQTEKPSLYVIGEFNNWGEELEGFQLESDGEGFHSIELSGKVFTHQSKYLLLDRGVTKRDPASSYFDTDGNSVFWDFEDPSAYKFKSRRPDRVNRSVKILQTDLPGLIHYFRGADGVLGSEVPQAQLYNFISNSGVINKIKDLGFNTIQFLPVSQAIDGDKWSFRYLVPYLFAINSKWGTPDDFASMIDSFHDAGIAVILDHVISHAPDQRFRLFDIPNRKIGIHRWLDDQDSPIYLGEDTSWGTKRYQYHNPQIRQFIVQSAVSLLKSYRIDGFRIDNVDGILRHGMNGDGNERDGGRELMRELATNLYKYDPKIYLHLESHYFHGDNAKMLVHSLDLDQKSLGATAYTSSRLSHYLHQEYMPKSADKISPWKFKDLVDEKEWGESNSTVADFHNHDAAAGLMPMRATGSYAYDALILNNPALHQHAIGKIKVMEGLISFGTEGRTLDLLQSLILQTGSFEHDSSIYWYLEHVEVSKAMLKYKTKVNQIMDSSAFWPRFINGRRYINIDDKSKTITIHRSGRPDSEYLILINLASHQLFDFVIPAFNAGEYSLELNSDQLQYAGQGISFIPNLVSAEQVDIFEHFNYGLRIGTVPGYAVLVFKK